MNRTGETSDLALHVFQAVSLVFLPGILLASFVAAMLVLSGAHLNLPAVLVLSLGGTVIVAAGFALVIWTNGENATSRLALAILLGSVSTSLILTAACLITHLSAGTVFTWWSVIATAAYLWALSKAPQIGKLKLQELFSLVVVGMLVAFWCRRSATLLPNLQLTGLVNVWSDYFIHATEIAQFGDPLALGQSSFLLAKQPIVFYHYASYMLPAAVAGLIDLPALGITSSVWLPFGLLLFALGSYAFARTVAGEEIALLVPFALFLIPDASTYGFQNGFFGFHWLLFTAPGSGYGLGVAFTAAALIARWQSHHHTPCLWLGLLLAIALFEFRAQIFLLFAPALAMTLLWETTVARHYVRLILLALLIVVLVSALSLTALPAVRDAWTRFSACPAFLELAHTRHQPTAYDGVYQLIEQHYGDGFAWIFGLCVLIPVTLGTITIALPMGLYAAIRRTGWKALDSFPLWCIATWLGIVLLAPTSTYGTVEEYQHRPFVLVYAGTFIWTLLFFDRAVAGTRLGVFQLKPLLLTLFVAILGIQAAVSWNHNPAQPRFGWGTQYFGLRLDLGLLEAAAFTHAHAANGDTFALIPTTPSMILDDAATRFAALANIPAYLARPGFQARYGQAREYVAKERLAELNKIEVTEQADEAFLELRKTGVRFLVVLGESGPRFDRDRTRATFQTAGAAVYRIAPPN